MKNVMIAVCLALALSSTANAAKLVEYRFEGNANDSSGNSLHGTLTGGTFVSGRSGLALQLDGNDFVSVAFPDLALSQFTVETWINVPTYNANVHYFSLYQGSNYIVLGDYASDIVSTWANGLTRLIHEPSRQGFADPV